MAASPSIGSVMPRGGQRGTEVSVTFGGARLADTQELMWYSPGITVSKLEAKDDRVVARLKIAADCRLGEHAVRVRSATGISELHTFWVGALPIVDEKEPNNEFSAPQPVPFGCTVHGTVTSEDVDLFAIEVKKGQRISAEIEALRLASSGATFDPFIAIVDSKRFELATSDDTPLHMQDGCASVVAPADGKYIVQVRESAYRGNGNCHYRLHIGPFPRPLSVTPLGGKPGEEVAFRFLGAPTGEIVKKIKLPAAIDDRFMLHVEDAGGISPSGVPVRVQNLSNVMEVEPNDAPAQATKGDGPCAFNGVIGKDNDHDYFRFHAGKGQVFDISCWARRLGSSLDPVIWILNPAGAQIAANDDSSGPDSYLRFTAPADGDYVIGIHDHLYKGGPAYSYRIEVTTVQPAVSVALPQFAQFSQDRQWIAVPRGNRYATYITASRANFGGDLEFEPRGLPAKLSATVDPMPPFMSLTPIVLEAAADAPLAGSLVDFTAHSAPHDARSAKLLSHFGCRSELVYGSPNTSLYWSYDAPKIAVAVTEAVPFKISIVQPKVPLVHNGSMNLKIVAERQSGFTGPITIYPMANPPGVGSAGSATIAANQNETVLPINANGGAPARKWKYVVWGVATVGNGPVWVSSQMATVEIAPPYLALNLERAMGEQGKTTTLFGKVQIATPWEGPAKVKLIGLPAKTSAPEVDVTKDTKEIAFPIALDSAAPPGQHRNLYCQVVVMQHGEPIVQNMGSSELRIDKPPAAAPAAAAPTAAKPAKAPAGEKRLSRLEQLRKEQEAREKGQQSGGSKP